MSDATPYRVRPTCASCGGEVIDATGRPLPLPQWFCAACGDYAPVTCGQLDDLYNQVGASSDCPQGAGPCLPSGDAP
jgi:hypothetical protein